MRISDWSSDVSSSYLRRFVVRRNSVTGRLYADDPAILSWQLANEPRPGGSDAMIARTADAYYDWIEATAKLIRGLDPGHLVSLGQEGTQATNGSEAMVLRAHRDVDYLTAHVWPLNWGWVDGGNLAGTWDRGSALSAAYVDAHARLAETLGKPLVIEEFGFPRDGDQKSNRLNSRH